jgi:hypothetical protein
MECRLGGGGAAAVPAEQEFSAIALSPELNKLPEITLARPSPRTHAARVLGIRCTTVMVHA